MLARREHSRKELGHKLAAYAEDPAEVERVLDDLESRGWLSEKRVVEQLVHARRARYGKQRIERDLVANGVSGEAIAAALPGIREGELQAARDVWRRKFRGQAPRNAAERGRQARFLQGRGFGMDVIIKVIKGIEED